jgi:hypothetical protein
VDLTLALIKVIKNLVGMTNLNLEGQYGLKAQRELRLISINSGFI